MTDVVVETLRIRAPRADRLVRVAALALPAALERSLADLDDGTIVEDVHVVLDLAADDHDDETLAVVWAEAIRGRLLTTGAARIRRGPAPGRGGLAGDGSPTRSEALTAARAWLATPEPRGPLPAAALVLALSGAHAAADDAGRVLGELARAVAAAMRGERLAPGGGPDEDAGDAADAAGNGRPAPPGGRGAATGPVPDRSALPPAPAGRPSGGPGGRDGGTGTGAHDEDGGAPPVPSAPATAAADLSGTASGSIGAVPDALARLRQLAELTTHAGAREVDLGLITSAAGLVLLYPWLGDLCRTATELHPAEEPAVVRRAALAMAVDPDRPALADDPLVRLLAGDGPDVLDGFAPLHRRDELLTAAERVLSSFASLLPGFGASSPQFVRAGWIARPGLLDVGDPVRLTAATGPLDIVLDRLPYPLGLVRLPWSPAISVRFAP